MTIMVKDMRLRLRRIGGSHNFGSDSPILGISILISSVNKSGCAGRDQSLYLPNFSHGRSRLFLQAGFSTDF
jgi:hypothetical protein